MQAIHLPSARSVLVRNAAQMTSSTRGMFAIDRTPPACRDFGATCGALHSRGGLDYGYRYARRQFQGFYSRC